MIVWQFVKALHALDLRSFLVTDCGQQHPISNERIGLYSLHTDRDTQRFHYMFEDRVDDRLHANGVQHARIVLYSVIQRPTACGADPKKVQFKYILTYLSRLTACQQSLERNNRIIFPKQLLDG